MAFSSKVRNPLSYNRKRVDNGDIEEQRLTNYNIMWTEIDELITDVSNHLDAHISCLDNMQHQANDLKKLFIIKTGKGFTSIKENESNQILFNRKKAENGDLEERVYDKYQQQPRFQSGRLSFNVATNYDALKTEMDEFLARAFSFIKQVISQLHPRSKQTEKIKQDLTLLTKMLRETRTSPAATTSPSN